MGAGNLRTSGSGTLPRIDRERAELRRRWVAEGWYAGDTLAAALRAGVAAHPDTRLHYVGVDHPAEVSLAEVLAAERWWPRRSTPRAARR